MISASYEAADLRKLEDFPVSKLVGTEMMQRIVNRTAGQNLRRYDGNRGPDGRFWPRLADSTIDRKRRRGGFSPSGLPKLVFKGDLRRRSFRGKVEAKPDGSAGEFGSTSVIAAYHQGGTTRKGKPHMPARPVLGVAKSDVKEIRGMICRAFERLHRER